MSDSKLVKYLWFPLSIILNGVSLINLQQDLLPALYSWVGLFEKIILYFDKFKSILFYPLTNIYKMVVGSSLPEWVTTYLMIGIIFSSIMHVSLKKLREGLQKDRREAMPFHEYIGVYLAMIVLYPPFLFHTLFLEYDSRDKREGKSIIFKYFIFSLILVLLATILNSALNNSPD